jgi:acyl-CoA synthetase (AMP-forming)/AMP-acid ligase II
MSQGSDSPLRVPDILDLIAFHATCRPSVIAITHLRIGQAHQEITWSDLLKRAQTARAVLVSELADENFVPSYTGKSIEVVCMLLGAIAGGKVYAGISPKFRLPQLLHVLEACDAKAALLDSGGLPVVRDGLPSSSRLRSTNWLQVDAVSAGPMARAAAQAIRAEASLKELVVAGGCADESGYAGSNVALDPDRAAVCLFTSGSTGAPKGVLVSWSDLFHRAVAECDLLELSVDDRLLSLLPFSFDVGLNQLISAMVSGAGLVILDSWMPKDIVDAIASQRITGVSGVPSIWLSVLKGQTTLDHQGAHASLRYLTISGGDMNPEQLRLFSSLAAGVGIFKTYGQTESFRSSALLPHEFALRPTSVGRSFGTARVYIVRDDGTLADVGEQGEVVHTGLGVMLGYLKETRTDEKRRPNPFRGDQDTSPFAIFTGDQGHLDEQGFLFLAGRQDDMVKVAGHRVHLAELAAEVARVPGVLAAEAVCVPVESGDPLLAVFAMTDTSGEAWTPERLRVEVTKRVPTYMLPRLIQLLASFPLTASGKPDRQALRYEAVRVLIPS